jgi:hypothetical protein
MTEGELQWVVVLVVDGEHYQLSHPEARDVIRWLRTPKPHEAEPDLKSIAAAVFLERLVDDPAHAKNPPMNDDEAGGILIALGRMAVKEGLTEREAALHDALLAHFAGQI